MNNILKIIFFIVVTVVGYTWATAGVYNMVLDHEKKLHKMEEVPKDIAVIKQSISSIDKAIERIEGKIK